MNLVELVGSKCKQGATLTIMKSNAGYYIGTEDECGLPNCRMSGYAKNKEELKDVLLRDCVENNYCNEGKGCIDGV